MLSRIADSLFWLNRYMERADGMLRLASTHYIFSLDKDVNGTMTWMAVMEIFTDSDEEYLNRSKIIRKTVSNACSWIPRIRTA